MCNLKDVHGERFNGCQRRSPYPYPYCIYKNALKSHSNIGGRNTMNLYFKKIMNFNLIYFDYLSYSLGDI